jgi:hypothetical protein
LLTFLNGFARPALPHVAAKVLPAHLAKPPFVGSVGETSTTYCGGKGFFKKFVPVLFTGKSAASVAEIKGKLSLCGQLKTAKSE